MPLTSSSPSQDSLLSSSSSHHPLERADLPLPPSTNPGSTSEPNPLTLTNLPQELFLHTLSFLSPNDLIRLGKAFPDGSPRQKLCDEPVLWKTLFSQHFPHAVRLVAAETNPDWKKAFLTLRMLFRYSPEDLIHRGNIFPDHSLNQQLCNDPALWKTLFTRHFPHAVWSVAQKNPDWKAAFITTSETEYRGLNPRAKRLFYFMKEGDLAALKREGLSHADLRIRDSRHQPLYHWAGMKKKQDLLDYCYQFAFSTYVSSIGALDLSKRDSEERTILWWAAAYGQPADFIFDLIQQGADCHAHDVNGATPLFFAAQNGHAQIVDLLMIKQANPKLALTRPKDGLIGFARGINPSVLRNMQLFINAQIRAGATESAITITPWQMACIMNNKNVLECLHRHGAAPNVQNENYASSSSTRSPTLFALSLSEEDQRFLDLCFRGRMVAPVTVLESACSVSSPQCG